MSRCRWTSEELQDAQKTGQAVIKEVKNARKDIIQVVSTLSASNVEPTACHESVAKKESPRLDTSCRYRVRITSFRNHLSDPDGLSCKAVIDGFVLAGLLADDSAKQIESIQQAQIKI